MAANEMSKEQQQHELLKQWHVWWNSEMLIWHKTELNPVFLKTYNELVTGRSGLTFLIPMCGKAVEMAWLHSLGHTVIGIEVVEKGVLTFFKEQNLNYIVEKLDQGALYQTPDKLLRIYCGDFFKISRELIGQVDFVWDRAAFHTIFTKDRPAYAELMKSYVKPGFFYLLEIFEYDVQIHELGSPKSVSCEEVEQLYGDRFKVEILETKEDGAPNEEKFQFVFKSMSFQNWKASKDDAMNTFKPIFTIRCTQRSISEQLDCNMAEETLPLERLRHWNHAWKTGNTRWHRAEPHPLLVKTYDKLTAGRRDLTFLIPLCGKAVELAWLYEHGSNVIGIEGVEKAVQEFFAESSLECIVEKNDLGLVYHTPDKRLRIYCGDFFSWPSDVIGKVDCVWDRGSLVAIRLQERQKYATVMKSHLKPGFQYLLEVIEYDAEMRPDVYPKSVSCKEVEELFGDFCSITVLESSSRQLKELPQIIGASRINVHGFLLQDKQHSQ